MTKKGQVVTIRVISVEAFRHEMYKLRNGFMREDDLKRPNETMVRIPVILWPGETMAQYTLKFERWLASRDIPLVSLRDNPAKERSLWHSFAYARAGTTESGEPIHPNATSRTPSQSAINADLLPRRERSYSPEQRHQAASSPSSIAPPENPRLLSNKTRRQLLERRILALEVFQQEVDHNPGAGVVGATEGNILPAIPVPLYPGESMGLYDHRFWTWLKDFNETKDSLRGNPAKERRFRMKFAYLRHEPD
ncbi:hypothetical protein PHPALM_27873 [Phytophthora palmivora]|uniref:Uncharacterized protein n=1 Tax=Phytophthora palmivora TaxID=4796 RepID=A0A2P4XBI5_9STRA|nr:hypothetical protein PHPALM_27873 [Phytophthora palmivora]